ncbi:MAG: glycosyltransferase family 4 protein [Wenzhouxiangellaceae bacterium]|nr:glycosyltransferase family 4 protein [Wenzhouxiangellaceae bacterium]
MSAFVWWPLVALLVAALTPLIRRHALARGMVDRPGPRRSHDQSVARGGGLALLLVCIPVALIVGGLRWPVPLFVVGALLLGLLGWIDDCRPLAPRWRFAVQLAVALLTCAWAGPVREVALAGVDLNAAWLWTPLALVAVVWLINLYNFMDGSDGLAAAQALISCALFALLLTASGATVTAWLAGLVAAACAGFLAWNAPRASIFLGDSGSLFLGWSVAFLAYLGAADERISIWLSAIVTAPFVIDATLTLVWRLRRGEQWYTAHRDHAYQKLIRMGWSHRRVLETFVGLNLLVVMPAVAAAWYWPDVDVWIALLVALLLSGAWYRVQFGTGNREANE